MNAGQAIVFNGGYVSAVLDGLTNTAKFCVGVPQLSAIIYDFRVMYWSYRSSLRQAQGETISTLLGPSTCLLRGAPRAAWDPRPGLDSVRILVIQENPERLDLLRVFQLAKQQGF